MSTEKRSTITLATSNGAPVGNTIAKSSATTTFGSGGGGPPVDAETQNYVDAKTEATRAQNDARFAEVMAKLETLDRTSAKSWTIFATGGALFLGILAVLAFGGDRFDGGAQMHSAVATQAAETRQLAEETAATVKVLEENQRALSRVFELAKPKDTNN